METRYPLLRSSTTLTKLTTLAKLNYQDGWKVSPQSIHKEMILLQTW